MKLLGKTLDGELIVQISQAEYDSIELLNLDDSDWNERKSLYPSTELGNFLMSHKGLKGKNSIRYLYLSGKIDGSLKSLWDIANGHIDVNQFGKIKREALREALTSA